MKKIIGILLVLSVLCGIVFAGGGQDNSSKGMDKDNELSFRSYVGTYSPNGKGVYLIEDSAKPKLVAEVINAGQLINKDNEYLYVASARTPDGTGYVHSYSINPDDGSLTFLNRVISEAPAYITVYENHVFVANYFAGSFEVFPIDTDGSLKPRSYLFESTGPLGSDYPVAAVEGSFAISGHDAPHPHIIESHGDYLYGTDLGLDRIYQWKFDKNEGILIPLDPPFIKSSSDGSGPRHFTIKDKNMYLINEESSTLTKYTINSDGTLEEDKTVSALPDYYVGTSFASGIISIGEHIYVLNRLHNSIARFSTDLEFIDETWTRGDYPRTLIDKDGYLYVMNQRSDNISIFEVSDDGELTFINKMFAVGSPSQMVFTK